MVDGTFIQIAPVALPTAQGTVRRTVITAVYALDSLGNVWKLMDHSCAQLSCTPSRVCQK
jgi:hypothetical protein